MTTTNWQTLPTKALQQRKNLTIFALRAVWVGALVAIAATLFRYFSDGIFPEVTFFTALTALLASLLVYREKRQILLELEQRRAE